MVVKTQTERIKAIRQGRDGALHLRPSARLPDLFGQRRLRIAGHGRRGRLARRALRLCRRKSRLRQDGRRGEPELAAKGRVQSVFHLRSVEMHRLLALRARLRGNARHFRADHRRPRLRQPRVAGHGRAVHDLGVRIVRRLRAGLPDRDAQRKEGHRDRQARAFGGDDLRLLRRRLLVQGRNARRGTGAHGAVQGRRGQPRPFLRQGPLRLGLCDPSRAHPQADDPRQGHRSVEGSELGRGDQLRRPPSSSASRPNTARIRSAASPRRAAPTKRPSWCRS